MFYHSHQNNDRFCFDEHWKFMAKTSVLRYYIGCVWWPVMYRNYQSIWSNIILKETIRQRKSLCSHLKVPISFSICGRIKQNESEFANIDLEIEPKEINAFIFYCFDNLSIGHNVGMVSLILMGFSAKCSSLHGK